MTSALAFPKPERLRDRKYLSWIKRQGCLLDGRSAHAHHLESGGVGTKGSDRLTVPLCWQHHRELHDRGRQAFEDRHGIEFLKEAVRLREKYEQFCPEEQR